MLFTENQESVIQDGVKWFRNSSEQIFEIDGEAGTGKSVCLYEIVRRLGLRAYQYMPMAYTGQASIIMRLKGFPHARSIHSSLYRLEKVPKMYGKTEQVKINTTFNTGEYTYNFRPLTTEEFPSDVDLMVIDEGYMPPEYMRQDILKHGRKVLVAGDSGQLPPIGGAPAFLTGYGIHHLTELMRQAKDNPIIYIAHRARHGDPIHLGLYGDKVLVIGEDELTNDMVLNIQNIICGTNKTRDFINNKKRQLLGFTTQLPQYGERLICRDNNWNVEEENIALANGLSGVVASPYSINSFNGKSFNIDFLPDLLQTPFRDLEVDYEYLISPYNVRKQMKSEKFGATQAWKTNGNKFEFAYALTTHLSQGAEYSNGIYYEEFLRSNIQNQLNYTGITRFKNRMIYVKKLKKFY